MQNRISKLQHKISNNTLYIVNLYFYEFNMITFLLFDCYFFFQGVLQLDTTVGPQ